MKYILVVIMCGYVLLLTDLSKENSIKDNVNTQSTQKKPLAFLGSITSDDGDIDVVEQLQRGRIEEMLTRQSELRSLTKGDQLRLIARGQDIDRVVNVVVTRLTRNPNYTQLYGDIQGGGTAKITLGGGLTNIFVKTHEATYEYVGQEFAGAVTKRKPVAWGNNIFRRMDPQIRMSDKPNISDLKRIRELAHKDHKD